MEDTTPTTTSEDNALRKDEDRPTDKMGALKDLTNDYAKYLHFPHLQKTMGGSIEETIEQMLTQLDELGSLVESSKSSTDSVRDAVPAILNQSAQLEKTFAFIDAIETLVQRLDSSLTKAEEKTTAVEQQYSFQIAEATKNFFSSFGLKRANSEVLVQKETPPLPEIEIVNTSQAFNKIREDLNKVKVLPLDS
eukprot:TRINITY_DN811_c0_g1_i1.p1 TRINITY_DN811_c0_g1~~TRINITY_DN811_c0_g1_i1.p1  ORF type:complete len:193 (+),score=77.28 TRINITY_DN811_c0_g1_i1:174-752(+)